VYLVYRPNLKTVLPRRTRVMCSRSPKPVTTNCFHVEVVYTSYNTICYMLCRTCVYHLNLNTVLSRASFHFNRWCRCHPNHNGSKTSHTRQLPSGHMHGSDTGVSPLLNCSAEYLVNLQAYCTENDSMNCRPIYL